jgi:hypothetical protein
MNSVWKSLIWKEWHEHKWKLAAIMAIVLALTLMFAGHDPRNMLLALMVSLAPISIFVGLGTAAGERSHGTLAFLQSQPISLRKVAACKLVMGLLTVVLPIVLSLRLMWIWAELRKSWSLPPNTGLAYLLTNQRLGVTTDVTVDLSLLIGSVVASLYLWAAAVGINRKDEISAGARAIPAMLAWWMLLYAAWSVILQRSQAPELARTWALGMGSLPGGVMWFLQHRAPPNGARFFGLFSALVTHLGLIVWYVRRFGRTADKASSSQVSEIGVADLDFRMYPIRGRVGVLIWKQMRESMPLALLGFAAISGIATVASLTSLQEPWWDSYAASLVMLTYLVGFPIALIVGISSCLSEVNPNTNSFWRTRPIPPDLWFGISFFTGALVLLTLLYLPLVALCLAVPTEVFPREVLSSEFTFVPVLHLAAYAAAVAMTCWVRRAVFAAILAVFVIYGEALLVSVLVLAAQNVGWLPWAGWQNQPNALAVYLLITIVLNTILAWLAFRNDWGVKGRG